MGRRYSLQLKMLSILAITVLALDLAACYDSTTESSTTEKAPVIITPLPSTSHESESSTTSKRSSFASLQRRSSFGHRNRNLEIQNKPLDGSNINNNNNNNGFPLQNPSLGVGNSINNNGFQLQNPPLGTSNGINNNGFQLQNAPIGTSIDNNGFPLQNPQLAAGINNNGFSLQNSQLAAGINNNGFQLQNPQIGVGINNNGFPLQNPPLGISSTTANSLQSQTLGGNLNPNLPILGQSTGFSNNNFASSNYANAAPQQQALGLNANRNVPNGGYANAFTRQQAVGLNSVNDIANAFAQAQSVSTSNNALASSNYIDSVRQRLAQAINNDFLSKQQSAGLNPNDFAPLVPIRQTAAINANNNFANAFEVASTGAQYNPNADYLTSLAQRQALAIQNDRYSGKNPGNSFARMDTLFPQSQSAALNLNNNNNNLASNVYTDPVKRVQAQALGNNGFVPTDIQPVPKKYEDLLNINNLVNFNSPNFSNNNNINNNNNNLASSNFVNNNDLASSNFLNGLGGQVLTTNNNAYLNYIAQAPKVGAPNSGLEVAFQFRFLDWVHPSVQLAGKNFTVGNPLSQDVDIDRRGRIFVTSPQWLPGTPITLSVITDLKGPGGPLLTPYPDWTWHKADCNGLVSVFRIAIDECNRLWMVDTGAVSGKSVCPMKIMVFDLNTDTLALKYIIPEEQTVDRTAQYVNPAVEVGESCQDTYLYVADVLKHGLLVYNMRENRSWRIGNTKGNAFGHDLEAGKVTIRGESIELTDGTLGISLSPKGFFNKRYLYFNSLSSYYQKFSDTDSLKRNFASNPPVYQSVAKRASQAGVQAISKSGAMFFQLAEYTALACWNIERPFTPENIVVLSQDEDALQYISGMKVIENARGDEELWFNTNRLQKTINNSRKMDEVNFRLIHGKVEDLIRGTRCAPTGYAPSEPNTQGWQKV